jgi:uncharacterized cofD-like protein
MSNRSPQVVAIGGGHGLAVTIRAVRCYAGRATAIVATADDGGSTGRLRSTMAIPAPGDLRRCLVAMAGAEEHPLGKAFEYRFGGTDVEGHALGNLLLAGLGAVTGDFLAATDEVARLLGLDPDRARVVPATVEPVELRATTVDGGTVVGQVAVGATGGIERVALDPPGVKAPTGLADLVREADQVVLGPGSLYTSVLAAAVVDELREALAATRAVRVYVCNLRAEAAETRGYDTARHVAALQAHGIEPDVVVVHTAGTAVPADPADPIDAADPPSPPEQASGVPVVAADVARPHGMAHDGVKLAAVLADLLP